MAVSSHREHGLCISAILYNIADLSTMLYKMANLNDSAGFDELVEVRENRV